MTPLEQLQLEVYCAGLIRYAEDAHIRLQRYEDAYAHFFSQVGAHPQFNLPDSAYIRYSRHLAGFLLDQIGSYKPGIRSVIEFGCGRGFLIAELARRLPESQCIGIDVALARDAPADLSNLIYQRMNVLAPDSGLPSADLVISDQVLEHIHPSDMQALITTIHAVLRPGGHLFIGTPNGLWGPHDVSGIFGLRQAIGFHLKEYSGEEVIRTFESNGFKFQSALLMLRNAGKSVSLKNYDRLERCISCIPTGIKGFLRDHRLLGWANIRFAFQKE